MTFRMIAAPVAVTELSIKHHNERILHLILTRTHYRCRIHAPTHIYCRMSEVQERVITLEDKVASLVEQVQLAVTKK